MDGDSVEQDIQTSGVMEHSLGVENPQLGMLDVAPGSLLRQVSGSVLQDSTNTRDFLPSDVNDTRKALFHASPRCPGVLSPNPRSVLKKVPRSARRLSASNRKRTSLGMSSRELQALVLNPHAGAMVDMERQIQRLQVERDELEGTCAELRALAGNKEDELEAALAARDLEKKWRLQVEVRAEVGWPEGGAVLPIRVQYKMIGLSAGDAQ